MNDNGQRSGRFAQCALVFGVIAFLGTGSVTLAQSAQNALPDGRGKAEFSRICSQCHSLETATARRMTEDGWTGVVNDMVSKGARGTDDEFDRVVKYLGANFGPNSPTGNANTPAATPAPEPNSASGTPARTTAPTAAESSAAASGKALVESNGCLTCHRVNEQGSRTGPKLSGIGNRRNPEQLKAAIVSPDSEVLPENRFVEVTLKDGTTVKGRILNHDALSVQLIDSKEQLRSFETSKIRGYTILTKGLMPSYANKLSDQQVSDIVAYLTSLKESD